MAEIAGLRREPLGESLYLYVSENHSFGTDALLLADFSNPRRKELVCDFGTGCGILPLAFHRRQPPEQTFALDIQPEAIALLERTKAEQSLSEIVPLCADLCALPPALPRNYLHLVTCNPPYQPCGSGKESPVAAHRIARHQVFCGLPEICRSAALLLRHGGRLCLCGRPTRLCDTISAMQAAGIEPKRLQFVAKNLESEPWLFLIDGKKGAKPFLRVLPTLYTCPGGVENYALRQLYLGKF